MIKFYIACADLQEKIYDFMNEKYEQGGDFDPDEVKEFAASLQIEISYDEIQSYYWELDEY